MQKVVSNITIDLPFQKSKFFASLAAGIVLCAIGLALLEIKFLAAMGLVILATTYFIPTIIGFDLLSSYNSDYKIEKLIHPKRHLILLINLCFGATIIGWMLALMIALNPGQVQAQRTDYFE